MKFPFFTIITARRWQELTGKHEQQERIIADMQRTADEQAWRIAAQERRVRDMAKEMKTLRKMFNQQNKKQWQYTGRYISVH